MIGLDFLSAVGGQAANDPAEPVERKGVRVERADESDLDSWNQWVEQSPQGTVFHRLAALRVQADHSETTLYPLVGYKGQEPVGIFPVFGGSKAGISAAFSPAPDLWISSLGPALVNFEHLKQRRAEKRHRRFIGAALDWIRETISPKYVHVSADRAYRDPRPFEWNDFSVEPRHTYVVDISRDVDALSKSFSSDARRNVDTDRDDYDISIGGADEIVRIIEQVRNRYEQQDKSFTLPPEAVVDLYERLPDGTVKPYVCRVDGEFVGGMVTLVGTDTIHRWQGGAKIDHDLPVNDLIDWRIIRDGVESDCSRYDMEGANELRLCGYKAKFAPDVVSYPQMEYGHPGVRLGSQLYTEFIR